MNEYFEPTKPPQSIEAEASVIGSCIIDCDIYDDVADIISPDDFFSRDNQECFKAMAELRADGKFDLITLTDKIGDIAHWGRIAKDTPSTRNAMQYARIIRERSNRRKVISATQNAQQAAFDLNENDYLGIAQAGIMEIEVGKSGGPVSAGDSLKGFLEGMERRYNGEDTGIQTGFTDLDEIVRSFKGGQLIVIAGRPKMGKTTFARCMMENIAKKDGPVLLFELEMSRDEMINCCIASQGRILLDEIETGKALEDSATQLAVAIKTVKDMPLYIDDTPGIDVHTIAARARRMHRKNKLSLIVVDHIGLVNSKGENRNLEIGNVTKALKVLAKDLDVPVIAISQLNRDLERRTNKKPIMADLRESGNIEQDADKIIFVYRDEVYNNATQHKGIAEIIVSAQRSGKTGSIPLKSNLHISRFDNFIGEIDFSEPQKQSRGFE